MKKFYLLMLTVFSMATFAQSYNYTLYNTVNSQIGSANIKHIEIDGSGVVWMTTSGSLTKFDGTTFTNYTTNDFPIDALGKFVIDNLNRKWIATAQSGLVLFDGTNWFAYTPANSGIPGYNVQDVAVDSANNVWLATYSGLVKFNGTTWTTYNTSNSNINTNSINSVAVNSSNSVYLTGESILMKYNGTTFSILGDQANKIRKVVNNDLYVDIASSGYLKYTNESVSEGQYYGNTCMLDCRVESMDVDQNNKVWMGFSPQCNNGGVQNYTDCKNYFPTIPGADFRDVSCLRLQSSNTIWVGTYEFGLVKMSLNTTGTCLAPTNITATNVTPTTATISWSAPSPAPNGYTIIYNNNSGVLGGISIYTTSTSVNLQNLTPNSDYHYWVASDCGNSQSDWSAAQFFPTPVEPPCFQKIATGAYHTIALKADGTLWAWGNGANGQLGNGNILITQLPIQIGTANDWQSIAGAGNETFAIKTNGTLWACGNNEYGQLGDGTTTNRNVLVQIGTATNWASIATGGDSTFAIKTDGSLWAWGRNIFGQLGDGTSTNRSVPTRIGTATNWRNVASSSYHTLATKTNGTLWAWGTNGDGQLGNGGIVPSTTTPIQIGTATNWDSVSAGWFCSMARKTNGTLWAWGNNLYGQLGYGTTNNANIPTQIGTSAEWQSFVTSGYHSLATRTNGTLWAWGKNTDGQLGDGTNTDRSTPIQIGFNNTWQNVAAGLQHSIAKKTDSKVWTWGYNGNGQLGDGGTSDFRNVPNAVACPTSLGVDAFETARTIKLYPNPVKDILNISYDTTISTVAIYDVLGQEMLTKLMNAKESSIDVSPLAAGTYLVKIVTDDALKTMKVIKE